MARSSVSGVLLLYDVVYHRYVEELCDDLSSRLDGAVSVTLARIPSSLSDLPQPTAVTQAEEHTTTITPGPSLASSCCHGSGGCGSTSPSTSTIPESSLQRWVRTLLYKLPPVAPRHQEVIL